ncbi:hypothetical protein [Pedobacter sp.]
MKIPYYAQKPGSFFFMHDELFRFQPEKQENLYPQRYTSLQNRIKPYYQ